MRYEGNYAATPLTVIGDRTGYQWVQLPIFSYIDRFVDAKLQKIKAVPSPVCDDTAYLRRVSIDLTGLPPTPEMVRAFVADKTPSQIKRTKLVDALLSSAEFNERWTNKWADLLSANSKYLGDRGVRKFRNWLHTSIAANKPYNKMATELIAAQGGNSFDQSNGQVNYLVLGVVGGGPAQDIYDAQTAKISREFLGIGSFPGRYDVVSVYHKARATS